MARTPKSEDRKKRDPRRPILIQAFRDGATVKEAADLIAVSESTVYLWLAKNPGLASEVAKAKSGIDDMVEAVTAMNCLDPDPAHNTLRMFWLKCRRGEVYRDRAEQKITHAFTELSDDELIARAAGLTGGSDPKGLEAPG